MTAIFPGWAVLKQRTIDSKVFVLLWNMKHGDGEEYCIAQHRFRGAKGGWRYLSRWAAAEEFETLDGVTPPAAGAWRNFA